MLELAMNHPALLWVFAAIVSLILEMTLPYFGFLFVSFAALVAALIAVSSKSQLVPTLAFLATSQFGQLFLRPRIVKKALQSSKGVPHRTTALLEKIGAVTALPKNPGDFARVTVEGQDWAAKSTDPLALGDRIAVTGSDGIVLIVNKT